MLLHFIAIARTGDVAVGQHGQARAQPERDRRQDRAPIRDGEPKFFARVCELIGRAELSERQYGDAQEELTQELEAAFASRPLAEWLELFDGEDVCVGPVATRAEASVEFGVPLSADDDAALGAHTAAWRAEVGG